MLQASTSFAAIEFSVQNKSSTGKFDRSEGYAHPKHGSSLVRSRFLKTEAAAWACAGNYAMSLLPPFHVHAGGAICEVGFPQANDTSDFFPSPFHPFYAKVRVAHEWCFASMARQYFRVSPSFHPLNFSMVLFLHIPVLIYSYLTSSYHPHIL